MRFSLCLCDSVAKSGCSRLGSSRGLSRRLGKIDSSLGGTYHHDRLDIACIV